MQLYSNRKIGLSHSTTNHLIHLIRCPARSIKHITVTSAAAAASGPFFQRAQTNSSRYGARKPPTIDPLHTHDSQAAVGPALVNRGLSADPIQALVAMIRSRAHAVDMFVAQHIDRSHMLSLGMLALQFVQLFTVWRPLPTGNQQPLNSLNVVCLLTEACPHPPVDTTQGCHLYALLCRGWPVWLTMLCEDNYGGGLLLAGVKTVALAAAASTSLLHLRLWWVANSMITTPATATAQEVAVHQKSPAACSREFAWGQAAVAGRLFLMHSLLAGAASLTPLHPPTASACVLGFCCYSASLVPLLPSKMRNRVAAQAYAYFSGFIFGWGRPGSETPTVTAAAATEQPSVPNSTTTSGSSSQHNGKGETSSSSSSSDESTRKAAHAAHQVVKLLLATEVSLIAAVVGFAMSWPLLGVAASTASSCGLLYLLFKSLPSSDDRLHNHIIKANDCVEVHVTLFDSHGVQVDSTLGGEPLILQAGGSEISSSSEPSSSDSSSSSSVFSQFSSSSNLQTGAGRMQSLAPLLEHILPGAFVGIPQSFSFRNLQQCFPPDAPIEQSSPKPPDYNLFGSQGLSLMQINRLQVEGEREAARLSQEADVDDSGLEPLYIASHLIWWQPVSDMKAKYKGLGPKLGDTFRYPLAGKAEGWVDVQVTAVARELMQLDAGIGLVGQEMTARVHVVRKVAA